MADLGWQGMCLPEEYGGQALPLTYAGLVLSEIGRTSPPCRCTAPWSPHLRSLRTAKRSSRTSTCPVWWAAT